MKFSKTLLASALVLGGAIACGDPAEPVAQTTPITVDVCGGLGFGWFAYQNEGGAWTRITPNSNGQLAFEATNKVSVAMALALFGTNFTQIINASADELKGNSGIPCELGIGTRTLSGTVTGLTGEQFVRISAAWAVDGANASDPTWVLEDLPTTPVDLVATRYATFSTQPANRVLVRRGITSPSGSLAALDFASSESGALEHATATFTNLGSGATVSAASAVITTNGTTHELGEMFSVQGSNTLAVSYFSLPAALRVATDVHVIEAGASSVEGTRTITNYYKTPATKSLAFGPMVSAPTVSNVATAPYVRPRALVPSQAEYPTGMMVSFNQTTGQSSANVISILTTSGFTDGRPASWDLTVPDMTSAQYQTAWGLQNTNYNWNVTAHSATSGSLLVGAIPAGDATITTATRSSGNAAGTQTATAMRRRGVFAIPATR